MGIETLYDAIQPEWQSYRVTDTQGYSIYGWVKFFCVWFQKNSPSRFARRGISLLWNKQKNNLTGLNFLNWSRCVCGAWRPKIFIFISIFFPSSATQNTMQPSQIDTTFKFYKCVYSRIIRHIMHHIKIGD